MIPALTRVHGEPIIEGDTLKYATIEFAGYFNYYYLRNGKLYRNEHNMIRQVLGEEIEYQD